MPGLHLDVKVNGQALDVYIAPMDFCRKFDVKVEKGDEVIVAGTQLQAVAGEPVVVLAREITTGIHDAKTGTFHPTLTVYLRNENGPFWVEPAAPPSTMPLTD